MTQKPKRKAKPASPASNSRAARSSNALVASHETSGPEYKVVELSTVDELSLEDAINERVRSGWRLDGIHFAMRDSSKRPAMAFLLFIRTSAGHSPGTEDRTRGSREQTQTVSTDPWGRLRQLAGAEPDVDQTGGGRR